MSSVKPISSVWGVMLATLLVATGTARAQELATPTVGDSPTALQLCRRAEDLRDANPLEAARIVDRVLNEYADKLVPVEGEADRFTQAAARMTALLRSSPAVRAEWEKAIAPAIARWTEEGDDAALARIAPFSIEGMRALLRLAQLDLEAGRAAAALARLERLDGAELARLGSPRDRAFALAMKARALSLEGSAARAKAVAAELDVLATEDVTLAPIAAALRKESDRNDTGATASAPIDAAASWQRIWRMGLPSSPFVRRYLNPVTGPLLSIPTAAQAAEEGALLTVMPHVSGDRIYYCEGHVVTAIDRLSRRVRWQRYFLSGDDVEIAPIGDLSEPVLAGDTLLVLTGHGSATRRTSSGRLVALDADTGEVRWEQWLSRLEPLDPDGGEGLFPHGTPLVVDDTVIVMGRKMTARLESVATLVGFDLADGSPRWMTYLVGCGSRPMSGLRAFSDPVAADGAVFVDSSLGAVARIDPSTGSILWLTRFPVPISEAGREALPWQTGAPVVIPAGVLSIAPDGHSVVLLDRETGAVLRAFPTGGGEAWGSPRLLRASRDGRAILAIGDDVALFDSSSLEQPRWTLSRQLAGAGIEPARTTVRGRVDFVEGPEVAGNERGLVAVPLADRLLLVDAESGRVANTIATELPGNVLVSDGQILLAGNDRLDCFMPPDAAERAVRAWIARDESDPTRALALLELGIQCDAPALIFEGVATTAAAVDRSGDDELRTELVHRILDGLAEIDLPDADMRRLLATARDAARSPADQVACHLAEGAWELRRHRATEAVAAWQRILDSPELRDVFIVEPDSQIPASAIVLGRLASLVGSTGPGGLAGRERAAEAALRALGPSPAPDRLVDVARAWTGSVAGASAALGAVQGLSAAGRERTAFVLLAESLRDRSRLAGLDASGRELVAALAALGRTEEWNDAVALELAALLDRTTAAGASAQDTHFVRSALRDAAPRHPAVRTWPSIGTETAGGATVPGVLAVLTPAAEAERPGDRALFVERGEAGERGASSERGEPAGFGDRAAPVATLSLRRGPDLDVVWSRPLDVADPVVLAHGDTIVLWQRGSSGDGSGASPGSTPSSAASTSIVALAAADGSQRWSVPVVADLFDRSRIVTSPIIARRPQRDAQALGPSDVIPIRADPWLILARRNGDVACVDLRDGTVRWRRDGVLDEIASDPNSGLVRVAAGSWVVALAGQRKLADGSTTTSLVMLDPALGDTIEAVDLPGHVDWVSIASGPCVLAAARSELHAFVPGQGRRAWSRLDHRIGNGEPSLQVGDRKLVVVARGVRRDEIVAVSLLDGAVAAEAFAPPRRSIPLSNLRSIERVGDAVTALYPDRLVVFDAAGRVTGQDAVAVDRSFATLLPTAETYMVIDPEASFMFQPNPDRLSSASSGAVLYQLSRRDGARLVVDPVVLPMGERALRWCVLDGVVVGSGAERSARVLLPTTPRIDF